ncbi:MAG: hypothetical protein N3D75_04390 [Candidatus Aenigmarchaeota archaeon]|nr:hypothetical protein [Candidatus Aenigmarchaeota archaeon]
MKALYTLVFLVFLFSAFAQRGDLPVQNREDMNTQNQGDQSQLKIQESNEIRLQENVSNDAKAGKSENAANSGQYNMSIKTRVNLVQQNQGNNTKISVQLSNGRNAEIKVMPNTASDIAIQRLRLRVCTEENNCSIELKEVGQGDQVRAVYEVQAQKQAKILGIFATKLQLRAQIDAENGETKIQKPWWSFLAVES